MAISRKECDHKYNTSPKGIARRRRYDQLPETRRVRRQRDLGYQRQRVLEQLMQVRKELAQIERTQLGNR